MWSLAGGTSNFNLYASPASGETGASGWSIANIVRRKQTSPNPGNWGAAHGTTRAMLIRVNGTLGTTTNTAPTVVNAISDQTAMAGTAFNYEFPADTFNDADAGDTLTYTATQSDDSALPSWLTFAPTTRTFSGTPLAADVGTVSVKVTASDGNGGSVSDTFDIVVSAVVPGSADGLVSNVGQDRFDSADLAISDYAQSFTTGANATGYTLSSIELNLDSRGAGGSTNTPTVKLFSGSANGTEVSTFAGPAMLDASSVKKKLCVHAGFNRHSSYVNHLLGRGRGRY